MLLFLSSFWSTKSGILDPDTFYYSQDGWKSLKDVLHAFFDSLALDSLGLPTDAETRVPLFRPLEIEF